MKVTTLGTGTPIPDADRAGAASLIEAGGQHLLVDCGRGVLMRLAAAGVGAGQLAAVFLTHLHSDHVTDFNDVLTTHWITSFVPTPLRVFGPAGTQELVDHTLAMLHPDVGYRLAHHEDLTWSPDIRVTEVTDGVVYDEGGVRVIAAPTDHRPVEPTVGFRFEHADTSIVCAGDTVPCEGLDRLVAGADVYVQTVLRRSMVEAVPSSRFQDILDYHSDLEQAGGTATRGGVGTFVLTHLIPGVPPGTEQAWADEAARHFAGRIVVADDLMVIEA